MSTVASLQIKIGADVSAAINGLSRAEFAADQVKEAYIAANNSSVQTGAAVAVWSQNFSTAAQVVQREIDKISTDNIDSEGKESVDTLKKIADTAVKAGNQVTVMASAFSGAQAIAGPALAGIARLIPSIGASLAALAGPIGLAIGLTAALGAAYFTNAGAINQVLTEEQKLNQQMTQEIAQAGVLFGVLKSGNLTNEKRASLIDDVNKKYDTTLKNLKNENEFVAQVDVAYQKLSESIKAKILLTGAQKELEGLIAQQIETEKLRSGLEAAAKAVPVLNKELADIGASPGQQFDASTFLGGAAGIVDINSKIDTQQEAINNKLGDMASLYNKVFTDAGKGGKETQTEAERIQDVLNNLSRSLEIIKVQNKEGLLPDAQVFNAQVDAIQSGISKIGEININSDAFKTLVADFKAFANQESVELPVIPVIQVDEVQSLTPVEPLADRMKKLMEDKLSKIRITFDDAPIKSFAEQFEKEISRIQEVTNVAGQVGGALFGAINQASANSIETRRQELDAYYQAELGLIENSLSSESAKNKKKEDLEKSVSAKRKAILRDEAVANKKASIFDATINTANAITRALATGGPILATIVGALGAAQIAAIASAPLPALAGGALVSGPNTVLVGEYPGANNNPELIAPVKNVQKYIVEAVQGAGGSSSQELHSFISNDDIMLATKRGEYRQKRFA